MDEQKSIRRPMRLFFIRNLILFGIALLVIYAGYFWLVRRIVVGPGEVLVLLKKDGSRSLPADQIIIPRAPDRVKDAEAFARWDKAYGDLQRHLRAGLPARHLLRLQPVRLRTRG